MPSLLDAAPPAGADADTVYLAFVEWAESTGIRALPRAGRGGHRDRLGQEPDPVDPDRHRQVARRGRRPLRRAERRRRSYYTAPIKALVSEKFFALVDVFGAENVGMITGDSSVNADAPIICCTAEILANLALRQGTELPTSARS